MLLSDEVYRREKIERKVEGWVVAWNRHAARIIYLPRARRARELSNMRSPEMYSFMIGWR